MVEPDDWRLLNVKRHLEGASFRLKPYRTKNAEWDHDHCAGCWAKFAESNIPDALREGYAVTSDYKHGEGLRVGMRRMLRCFERAASLAACGMSGMAC
jgi:hypothetical protein